MLVTLILVILPITLLVIFVENVWIRQLLIAIFIISGRMAWLKLTDNL